MGESNKRVILTTKPNPMGFGATRGEQSLGMDNFAGVGSNNALGVPCLFYSMRGGEWWKDARKGKGSTLLQPRAAEAVPGCPEEHCMEWSPSCLLNSPFKACAGFEVCSEAFPVGEIEWVSVEP